MVIPKFPKTLLAIFLITLSLTALILLHASIMKAYAAGTLVKVEPAQTNINVAETERFNVTIKVYDVTDLYAYQVKLYVDDTVLGITRAWRGQWDSSWIFYGQSTVGTAPAYYDLDSDGVVESVLVGDSLLGAEYGVSGSGLLAIIEFKVLQSPAQATLNIDNVDTMLLDSNLDEMSSVTKENGQVSITGVIVEKFPSEITINVSSTQVFEGENVTVTGRVLGNGSIPIPDAEVILERYESPIWLPLGNATTDADGNYAFIWTTSEDDIPAGSNVANIPIRAKWEGNQDYLGNFSSSATVTVKRLTTALLLKGATNQTDIGGKYMKLPSPPVPFNITVIDVTDLFEWNVKIYYNPLFLELNATWLPEDHVFSNKSYTAKEVVTGSDDFGSFVVFGARLSDGEVGFSGNGTLFQVNFTGIRPNAPFNVENYIMFSREYGDRDYTYLINSTGHEILFKYNKLAVAVRGILETTFGVINPITNDKYFVFDVYKTPVGSTFNTTIVVKEATSMFGWTVKLSFNSTQLRLSRVIPPTFDPNYVFYGKSRNLETVIIDNELLMNETLSAGESSISVASTPKLLVIVEFEIILAPPEPKNATEIPRLISNLNITHSETKYLSETVWTPVKTEDGEYVYAYGTQSTEEGGGRRTILEYWPYFLTFAVVVSVVYVVLKRRIKKKEEVYVEE